MANRIQMAPVLLLLALILATACVQTRSAEYPAEIEKVLERAGDNRGELQKTLTYFQQRGDSMGLASARYLIGNIEGHRYTIYALYDSSHSEISLDVLDYPDYQTLIKALDDIESRQGELDFEKKDSIMDIDIITSQYLIENITWALKAWHEKPWSRHLSFDDFCAYVLPYRGSGEPLQSWRQSCWQRYEGLKQKMQNPHDPIEAAQLINSDIQSWFRFDERFYCHPTDQGLSEMVTNQMGRCEDMTNLTMYAMRANGLAVTSDYTPAWANAGNNHAWNAILTPDGRAIPFMGAEANPGEYRLRHRVAKVYRKMYAQQPGNLAFLKNEDEDVPPWLRGRSYSDVTADYVDISDVTIACDSAAAGGRRFAYLAVFNSGEWRAIHWGQINDGQVTFTDMGTDIVYLPTIYFDKELVPFAAPFILGPDGRTTTLPADTMRTATIKLTATDPQSCAGDSGETAVSHLLAGTEYELFFFNDGWQSLGTMVTGEKPLKWRDVPDGGLYWLVAKDSRKEERIFTLENGRQVWW